MWKGAMNLLNGLFIGVSVAFLICVVVFLVERLKACSVKATVLKATSSLLFVILACVAVLIKPENSGYGMMFIIGMVLCTIGDIWLDLKYVHKEYDEQYTFVGIQLIYLLYQSFILHVFFISLLNLHHIFQ